MIQIFNIERSTTTSTQLNSHHTIPGSLKRVAHTLTFRTGDLSPLQFL